MFIGDSAKQGPAGQAARMSFYFFIGLVLILGLSSARNEFCSSEVGLMLTYRPLLFKDRLFSRFFSTNFHAAFFFIFHVVRM